ncbi:hypothetical protein QUH73_00720 [Labilibaculum sp. K2S]|uniref:hypothetical protein n=1 Tax=Labilibaculum sp. K2S TaxID=3056386 RepID=UPI0025A42505|nr:hypothetical protein [Labilibaculum sp. K2S]MDM8158325.1 hypothetical protein [Labilibaculum sp. K2S]
MTKSIVKILFLPLLASVALSYQTDTYEIAQYNNLINDTDTTLHPVSESLYPILTDAINKGIASFYQEQITLIQYPSQGSLKWYYQNLNGIFNEGTFNYVSARVQPSEDSKYLASLSHAGGFPNAYSNLLKKIYYNTGETEQLNDSIPKGRWALKQLTNNTCYPSSENGGMKTINPNTGAISESYQVAYTISNPINQLRTELKNNRKSIKIEIKINNPSPIKVQIITYNETTTDSILYCLPDSITSLLLPFNAGTMKNGILGMEYYGITMFHISPKNWEYKSNTGWYNGFPIADAVKNTNPKTKGYHFAVTPKYNLGLLKDGGDFGFITNLLICDSLVSTLSDIDEPIVKENPNTCTPSNLFRGNRTSNENVVINLKESIFPKLRVPILEQTATVIGGTFCFPGAEKVTP